MVRASISLVFSYDDEIVKKVKNNEKKEQQTQQIVLLARNKRNSGENIISKALTHAEINHDEFVSFNNEVAKYCTTK